MTKQKKVVLVTAGPTREHIDPVRFISNLSSGRLGYEIAIAAHKRGYEVVLISGPTHLRAPRGVCMVPVISARQLEKAVLRFFHQADVLFMTSAVCDYRPIRPRREKIKRKSTMALSLEGTPDILKRIIPYKKKQIVCGFCLETSNLVSRARMKLQKKKLDFIVAHRYHRGDNPFGDTMVKPLILDKEGNRYQLPAQTKQAVARYLLHLTMG
ncbi:MAG: phosphopantothenoylcysteine decarboxylase [Candidatus Omnitrophica bacterium]|nr:phosphopantothenoylcysteine decarboxylase [Candidatus Omnitrophota bacterium]